MRELAQEHTMDDPHVTQTIRVLLDMPQNTKPLTCSTGDDSDDEPFARCGELLGIIDTQRNQLLVLVSLRLSGLYRPFLWRRGPTFIWGLGTLHCRHAK